MSRVVALGLDGFPYSLLRRLVGEGRMPHMAALLARGSIAEMESVYPTVSSVAWASVVTGKNPGKFGVFGFTEVDPQMQLRVPTSRDVRARTLWEIASAAGRRVIGLGVPLTYPPRPVKGILVSDFLAPRLEGAVHPATILPRIRKHGYRIDIDAQRARQSPDFLCNDLHEALAARQRTVLDFLENDPWDLLVCHVMETDRLHHFLWHAIEEEQSPHHAFVMDFYATVDTLVGEAAKRIDSDTVLMVMSDHGFCRCRHEVQVNFYLRREGYLHLGDGAAQGFQAVGHQSRAFAQVPGRIYLHLRGRWQNGSVEPKSSLALRDEIIERFRRWRDPETGTPICRKVLRKEDAFRGPYLATAPDIILDPTDGYDLKADFDASSLFTHGPISGMHTHDDAFLYISRGSIRCPHPAVYNVGGTILQLLDLPVPADWDGQAVLG